MDVKTFHSTDDLPDVPFNRTVPFTGRMQTRAVRVEIPVSGCVGVTQSSIIVLDAEDTMDILIEHDDGSRECVYSFIKAEEV